LVATAAGAAGALDYALSYPERVRSLVLADGTAGVQDAGYLELLKRIRPPEIDALPVELRELSASYRGADPEGTQRWIEIERASRQEGPRLSRQGSRNQVTFSLLETLSVATLILAGDADMRTPPSQMRLLAAKIPGAQFATVPEAGHAAHWEQPEIWNRTVLEFIASHQ
ncbi:MAG TPA: alpha/beta fold hydrolase, partial [Dehalococcoidia bacterium]|nr:alpha/beta fold hydrolase [Dehalococcoidia bacterium]